METLTSILGQVFSLGESAQDLNVLQICARAAVVYVALIGFVRLDKRRFLGGATALDVILIIVIGSVAARAVTRNAPLGGSLAAVFALIMLYWFFICNASLAVVQSSHQGQLNAANKQWARRSKGPLGATD